MPKINNRNTRTKCEINSKLTIKTPERRRRRSGVFIVNLELLSHFFLVFILLTLSRQMPAGLEVKGYKFSLDVRTLSFLLSF